MVTRFTFRILFCILLIGQTGYSQVINKAEYFFDADPGQGNGIAIPLTIAGYHIVLNQIIPTNQLSSGNHTLFIRTRTANGVWSIPEARSITINPSLTAAEYFIDADPGQGNAIAISPLTSGDSVNINFNVSSTSLSSGSHQLFIRFKNQQGIWSFPEARSFFINPSITAAEYFVDNDPGQGNATPVSIVTSDSVFPNFNINTASLNSGLHNLYFRTRNQQGIWSIPESRSFNVLPAIDRAEYFVDADPGQGNGIPIPVTTASDSVNLVLTAATQNLTSGNHTIYTRTRNQSGVWSIPEARNFTILPSIKAAEYFIDADPGQGNGITVNVTNSDSIQTIAQINTANLISGNHTIYFRTKNQQDIWSIPEARTFTVLPAITALEYFVDSDPGTGNATAVNIAALSDSQNVNFALVTNSLSSGIHTLFLRSKNQQGIWSISETRTFTVLPAITAAEYFTDADPGAGNGAPIAISSYDSVNTNLTIPTSSLSSGLHQLYIRTKNQQGIWSIPEARSFTILPAIIAAEYFVDNDPGQGSATSISLSNPGDSSTFSFSLATLSLTPGNHSLYIRSKSQSGIWSIPEKRDFIIRPAINKAEYFVDNDPGPGLGTAINYSASDSASFNFNLQTTGFALGKHTLYLRTQSTSGVWSIPEARTFTIGNDVAVNFKLFIQGFYIGNGQMAAVLDPVNRPTVCDSIEITLASMQSPYPMLASIKTVINTDGSALVNYPENLFGQSCYLVIKHRNSMQVWSKYPVRLNSDIVSFDFSTTNLSNRISPQ